MATTTTAAADIPAAFRANPMLNSLISRHCVPGHPVGFLYAVFPPRGGAGAGTEAEAETSASAQPPPIALVVYPHALGSRAVLSVAMPASVIDGPRGYSVMEHVTSMRGIEFAGEWQRFDEAPGTETVHSGPIELFDIKRHADGSVSMGPGKPTKETMSFLSGEESMIVSMLCWNGIEQAITLHADDGDISTSPSGGNYRLFRIQGLGYEALFVTSKYITTGDAMRTLRLDTDFSFRSCFVSARVSGFLPKFGATSTLGWRRISQPTPLDIKRAVAVFLPDSLSDIVSTYAHRDDFHLSHEAFLDGHVNVHRAAKRQSAIDELRSKSFSILAAADRTGGAYTDREYSYEYDFKRRTAISAGWMKHLGFPEPTVAPNIDYRTETLSAWILERTSIDRQREETAVVRDGTAFNFTDGVAEGGLRLYHLAGNPAVVDTRDLVSVRSNGGSGSSSGSRKRKMYDQTPHE